MSSSIPEKNINRYDPRSIFGERGSRFCLLGVNNHNPTNPVTASKVNALLEGNTFRSMPTSAEQACTIGGCTLTIIQDTQNGRVISGQCLATDYCLKDKFEASGSAATAEERKKLYKQIMNTTQGAHSKNSAGNFCPKIDCELSAGFSVDGIGGTAGECAVEIAPKSPQLQIDFERIRPNSD